MCIRDTNGSGAVTYQWQSSTAFGGPFTDIIGATSSTYTPSSAVAGTTYYQVVINAANNGCDAITSTVATVVVNPDLSITAQPVDINECIGGTDQLSVTISNGSGAVTYQWQSSTAFGGPFKNINCATNPT